MTSVGIKDTKNSTEYDLFAQTVNITCPYFDDCLGTTYNDGFKKYFCSNSNEDKCATHRYRSSQQNI